MDASDEDTLTLFSLTFFVFSFDSGVNDIDFLLNLWLIFFEDSLLPLSLEVDASDEETIILFFTAFLVLSVDTGVEDKDFLLFLLLILTKDSLLSLSLEVDAPDEDKITLFFNFLLVAFRRDSPLLFELFWPSVLLCARVTTQPSLSLDLEIPPSSRFIDMFF